MVQPGQEPVEVPPRLVLQPVLPIHLHLVLLGIALARVADPMMAQLLVGLADPGRTVVLVGQTEVVVQPPAAVAVAAALV